MTAFLLLTIAVASAIHCAWRADCAEREVERLREEMAFRNADPARDMAGKFASLRKERTAQLRRELGLEGRAA